jgi:CubicO group peptidase (beta-lactamase class C family)
MRKKILLIFIILLTILTACSTLPASDPPGSGLSKHGTPESMGMSSDRLVQMTKNIEKNFPAIRSVLVIKNDSLIFEWNKKEINPDNVVLIHSGAKIIIALLAGIAVHDGVFESEYTTIGDICPKELLEGGRVNSDILNTDIDTLLKMESGIDFTDMKASLKVLKQRIKTDSNVMYNVIRLRSDPLKKGEFNYLTESYLTVSSMLMEASGMSDYDYTVEKLFKPLGISPIAYTVDYENMGKVGRDLYMRPVDFTKIGMLLLDKGKYEGQQIVPEEWVEKCMTAQTKGPGEEYPDQKDMDFAYGLWLDQYKGRQIIFSYGKNGQYLLMFPQEDLLLTVMSDEKEHSLFYRGKLLDWLTSAIIDF